MNDPLGFPSPVTPTAESNGHASSNGADPTPAAAPSIETILYNAGVITADELGELVRDAVLARRPIAALAVERNLVTTQALRTLLAELQPAVSLEEALGFAAPAPEEPAPGAPALEAPAPVGEAAVEAPGPVLESAAPAPPASAEPPAVPAPAPAPAQAEPAPVEPLVAAEPLVEAEPPVVAAPPVAAAPPVVAEPPVATAPPVAAGSAVVAQPTAPAQPATPERPPAPEPAPASPRLEDEDAANPAAGAVASAAGRQEEAVARLEYRVLLRLAGGERVAVGGAPTHESAAELARSTAQHFATSTEWPLVGSRCIRPDAVISVDIERALDD